jgi:uncharacterized LabA/DUF88 family protein
MRAAAVDAQDAPAKKMPMGRPVVQAAAPGLFEDSAIPRTTATATAATAAKAVVRTPAAKAGAKTTATKAVAKTPRRVIVFIDYQNVRNDLRAAFAPTASAALGGQFHPAKLAAALVAQLGEGAVLTGVRVYTGMPDPRRESSHAAAAAKQATSWRRAKVVLLARPLLYPADWPNTPAVQKGVDTEMAIDIAMMAGRDYDIGIVATTDTDLLPAIERVAESAPGVVVCTVDITGANKGLHLVRKGFILRRLSLDAGHFAACRDGSRHGAPPARTAARPAAKRPAGSPAAKNPAATAPAAKKPAAPAAKKQGVAAAAKKRAATAPAVVRKPAAAAADKKPAPPRTPAVGRPPVRRQGRTDG